MLLETLADVDDEIAELYLEGEDISVETLKAAIRRATIADKVNPVLTGSAFKNKGVQPMLDAVVDYLPSPLDVDHVTGTLQDGVTEVERKTDESEPFASLAFKIATDPHLGKLTFVRIYSGVVENGAQVLNSTKDRKERIGKIYQMHANKREELPRAGAGDIIAVAGLKQTTTGDTLSDPQKPIVLESMTFPAPVIEVAIEPKTKSDQEKLGVAIQKLAEEDPTFQVQNDEETGQTIIKGMGELHLEILVDRMRREFKVEANVGKPQVAYRETIKRIVEREDLTYKKQTGGSGQYAKVQIRLEPLELTSDGPTYEFENAVTGGRIPKEFIPSVDQGAQEAMQYGILAGYPLVGVKMTLTDGGYHDVDSSEMAFKIAGSMVFKAAARKAQPGAARADDGRRGHHARREHGRRDRRPELPPRPDPGHGGAQRRAGRQGAGAAVGDVRLRRRPAVQDAGPGQLLDAVRQLRRGPAERGQGDHREGDGRVTVDRDAPRIARSITITAPEFNEIHLPDREDRHSPKERDPQWRRRSSSGPSRTSTSAPSVTSTMARRR